MCKCRPIHKTCPLTRWRKCRKTVGYRVLHKLSQNKVQKYMYRCCCLLSQSGGNRSLQIHQQNHTLYINFGLHECVCVSAYNNYYNEWIFSLLTSMSPMIKQLVLKCTKFNRVFTYLVLCMSRNLNVTDNSKENNPSKLC